MPSNFIIQKGPGIAAKAYNYAKKLFKGGAKASKDQSAINFVNPSVPSTRVEKARRDLMLAKRKRAGSEAKLNTTKFEIKQGQKDLTFDYTKKDVPKKSELKGGRLQKKVKTFTAPENFNKGGRVGYRLGSPKKSKLKKIQEAFKVTPSFMTVKKEKPKKRLMAKKGSPDPKKKKKKFPDLTGDGKVTFADILKGRGVINGKKKKTKKKII